jgi:hypothetical protein
MVVIIMGVAGAGVPPDALLLTGMAGLLAGALSMAAGEYVSVRSQREFYEHQIGLEREELAAYPDEEAEELALIYNARGLAMDEAFRVLKPGGTASFSTEFLIEGDPLELRPALPCAHLAFVARHRVVQRLRRPARAGAVQQAPLFLRSPRPGSGLGGERL